jgi:hypothetical protein
MFLNPAKIVKTNTGRRPRLLVKLQAVLFVEAILFAIIVNLLVAAEEKRPLDYRTISLNGDKGGTLAIIDDGVRLVNSPSAWTEWTLRETERGWTIQGRLSKDKPELRYLNVNEAGKITLVAELENGAYWKLTRKGERPTSFDAAIQAKVGKFDGWYLGFSDEQEEIERGKLKYKSYRPLLSEKPGPRSNLNIFIDGP